MYLGAACKIVFFASRLGSRDHAERYLRPAADQEVIDFIRSTFRSVWSIELLRVLQDDPRKTWSEAELVASLRASILVVSQALESLIAAGLVVEIEKGIVRYQPVAERQGTLSKAAISLYARSPDAVRRLIISSAAKGPNAFANAFRFRKD